MKKHTVKKLYYSIGQSNLLHKIPTHNRMCKNEAIFYNPIAHADFNKNEFRCDPIENPTVYKNADRFTDVIIYSVESNGYSFKHIIPTKYPRCRYWFPD